MRPPPFRTRLLGHPAVAGVVLVVGGCMLLRAWHTGDAVLIPAIFVALALSRVVKASEWIAQYRGWKREWDGMAEPVTRRRRDWRRKACAGLFGVSLAYCLADPGNPAAGAAVLFFGLAGALWMVVTLLRKLGAAIPARTGEAEAGGSHTVAISARPVVAVPSLTDAYGALPRHCWDVIGR